MQDYSFSPQTTKCSKGLTLAIPLPHHYHEALHVPSAAQVHHPQGLVHAEVVEDRTSGEGAVEGAVHRQPRPAVVPTEPLVAEVVTPSAPRPGQVLHWGGGEESKH